MMIQSSPGNTRHLNVYVDESLGEKVARLAEADDRSISQFIGRILTRELQRENEAA